MSKTVLIRQVAALGAAACLLASAGVSAAQAATAGILPPRNPAENCSGAGSVAIASIDSCRAQEGVGPLALPSNWSTLTTVQQGFVLINLERVNRGLAPIVGLSPALNQLASVAAVKNDDPVFPSGGFTGGGSIWAGAPTVFAADYLWMYDDGPNGSNLDCASAGDPLCWGHRDIMLWDRSGTLVAGGGHSGAAGNGSFAYLVLSGYSTANLTFTWSQELRYFAVKPAVQPTAKIARAIRHKKKKPVKHKRHTSKSTGARDVGARPSLTFG